jgi:AcrR family transcriptional regulator
VTTTGSPRGGYAKGRARRETIIRTASDEFAQKGFLAATILDIAAACDISRAGLLHHFPDKEALLEAVLEERDREDQARFRPYTRAAGGIGVLRGMVDLADHNRLVPGLVELFVRLAAEASAPDHPAYVYFLERYDRIRAGTTRAFESVARAGYLRPEVDPAGAAVRLTALMDGLQSQWLFRPDIDMASHIEAAIAQWLTPAGHEAFARAAVLVDSKDRPNTP